MLVAEIKSTAGPVDSLQLDKANRQKIRVENLISHLHVSVLYWEVSWSLTSTLQISSKVKAA